MFDEMVFNLSLQNVVWLFKEMNDVDISFCVCIVSCGQDCVKIFFKGVREIFNGLEKVLNGQAWSSRHVFVRQGLKVFKDVYELCFFDLKKKLIPHGKLDEVTSWLICKQFEDTTQKFIQ